MSTENITVVAKRLAAACREAGKRARTEEDLKLAFEKALAPALEALGINYAPEYERPTLAGGTQDAVYGHVTIEYKRPGRFRSKAGVKETMNQLARYLRESASHKGKLNPQDLRRRAGVGLDGNSILFVRYLPAGMPTTIPLPSLPTHQLTFFPEGEPEARFHMLGPFLVTPESMAAFLLHLRGLARRRLTPESLATTFGPSGSVSEKVVPVFLIHVEARSTPKIDRLFAEWDRLFGIVYGQELAKAERDARELAAHYGVSRATSLKPLLFSVHSYFALFLKLLAAELATLQGGPLLGSFLQGLPVLSGEDLRCQLEDLEQEGGLFARLGIRNFLEADFFGWYLGTWNSEVEGAVRALIEELSQFEPATATLEPQATRDLLKKLYQYLVPKKLRHDLGEYYTPDWLAEMLLNQLGYDTKDSDLLNHRLLDPACGSGTFLVLAIQRAREIGEAKLIDRRRIVNQILSNIVGFDLNPLAVIAARTNYLMALGDLRAAAREVEIPVYMCDSVLTPSEHVIQYGSDLFPDERHGFILRTAAGKFVVPTDVAVKRKLEILAIEVEKGVTARLSRDQFEERILKELALDQPQACEQVLAVYERILELEQLGENRIWARLLKNAFAPVFVGRFDYVVGNPPWVNWQNLSDDYRRVTAPMWQEYGLIPERGQLGKMRGGKKDLAMLFTYAAADHYLQPRGKLGFVITQTVTKTVGAGYGFRRFRLGESGSQLRVVHFDDLTKLQPFEGAANRTGVLVLRKGERTNYPLPYTLWRRGAGTPSPDASLSEISNQNPRAYLSAMPVNPEDPQTAWITARRGALRAVQKVIGPSYYEAHEGSNTGGANGVYWLRIVAARGDRSLFVENIPDAGRVQLPQRQVVVEADHLYPLLRGRDVRCWHAQPVLFILAPQSERDVRSGISEQELKRACPQTYAYLDHFKDILAKRPDRKYYPPNSPFYTMRNVAGYTMASHKVVWREVSNQIDAAVCSSKRVAGVTKVVVPDHTLVLVAFEDEEEAHYFCAAINSAPSQLVVRGYVALHPSPHVLGNMSIPVFEKNNQIHRRLAKLSFAAHAANSAGDQENLKSLEEEVNAATTELWGLSSREMLEISRSLREL